MSGHSQSTETSHPSRHWILHPLSIVAGVFAGLHVVLVAVPLILSGGNGESQAFAVSIFDYPLCWILEQSAWGRDLLYGNLGDGGQKMYVLVFALGGTIFWAGAGVLMTYGIRRLLVAGRVTFS